VLLFSKRNFDQTPLLDPAAAPSGAAVSGGGLHEDHHLVNR